MRTIIFICVVFLPTFLMAQEPHLSRVVVLDSARGDYKVTVTITLTQRLESYARYTDFIPNGSRFIRVVNLGRSDLKLDGNKVKFIWTDYPANLTVQISYIISFDGKPVADFPGQFQYLTGFEKQSVDLKVEDSSLLKH
jgi:hypothetical protein